MSDQRDHTNGRTNTAVRQGDLALLRYAFLLTGNRQDAEDLLQEATIKMLETQRSGREVAQPDAYMKKIVSNTFLNGRRRAALWRRHVASITIFEHGDSLEEQAIVRDELWRALHRLPRRQRTAVVLRYYQDLSFAAAAEVLDCTEATARSLVRRALSRLRVIVKEDEVLKT